MKTSGCGPDSLPPRKACISLAASERCKQSPSWFLVSDTHTVLEGYLLIFQSPTVEEKMFMSIKVKRNFNL